jgi:ornithine carbamoyltransferase
LEVPLALPLPVERLRELITSDASGWRKQNCVSLLDHSAGRIRAVLETAAELKAHDLQRKSTVFWDYPRTLAMLFQKSSLRTRVSFEVSMAHLQGHAVYLSPDDVGLGIRESVEDVAHGLSRWVDAITARVYKHTMVTGLAEHASVPVINALSDQEHPIQAFADLLTLQEHCGPLGNERHLAYVGDGNNVLHALLIGCTKLGVNISAAYPKGYEPSSEYVAAAMREARATGAKVTLTHDPAEAVSGAEAIYTDVWASMGQEHEKDERAAIFAPYQVNSALLAKAGAGAIAMHCLPAHRDEEISSEVMALHNTVIFDQAENRLHTQKALLLLILGL